MATIKQIIAALPVGKANAVSVPQFEQSVGNLPKGTNNDTTRGEVKDAILQNGIPIGSTSGRSGGYWLIDSDAECAAIVASLNSTIADYTAKRDAIQNGWNRRKASKAAGNPWPK
jgi:hypothetical protein